MTDKDMEMERRPSAAGAAKKKNPKGFDKDDWGAVVPEQDTGPAWDTLTGKQKFYRVFIGISKFVGVFTFLYFFICSLTLLSNAFKLIAGKNTTALTDNPYVKNPIVGLIVGILLTVLVQSSSTSTSIIVSMVSAGMLPVHDAIPIIMGSNVGTSVTNTLVSLTQVGDRAIFRRAFAGGTVHDMFNWLTVIVLLTIEVITNMLEDLTGAVVKTLINSKGGSVKILTVITDPFTNLIVELDEEVMNCWAQRYWYDLNSILKRFCETNDFNTTTSVPLTTTTMLSTTAATTAATTMATAATTVATVASTTVAKIFPMVTNVATTIRPNFSEQCPLDHDIVPGVGVGVPKSCNYLFYDRGMADVYVGIILLIISLVMLASSLIGIVKLLSSMLEGSIATIINKTLNANVPYVPWLTGYIAILVGAVMTFIIQSSSIFTSTLTPIIGLGILSVERAYPLMLGSNIGTTTTALIASLASDSRGLENAVQIALVHLFFNVIGICIWYPIPFMRVPIVLCKILGNITAEYRWFAIVYLVGMFFVMPVAIFALSVAGFTVMWIVVGPILIILVIVIIINIIQDKWPNILPGFLKDFSFLPEFMRSLEPYDQMFLSLPCCRSCRDAHFDDELDEVVSVVGSRKASRIDEVVVEKEEGRKRSRVEEMEPEKHHSRKSSSSSSSSSSSGASSHKKHSLTNKEGEGHDNKAMIHEE